MMEAARSSETFVNFYQTTCRYNPDDKNNGSSILYCLRKRLSMELRKAQFRASYLRNVILSDQHSEQYKCLDTETELNER
jgi:hypothetical protein